MALALNQRYRPLSFNTALSQDDEDGPDFRPNPELADFSGGEATGPAEDLQAPADTEPHLKNKGAMDEGAGKVPANMPAPMAGGPPGYQDSETPDGNDPGPQLGNPDGLDDEAAAPAAMRGGPKSASQIAMDALQERTSQKAPSYKNNKLQTIGQAALGMTTLGPNAAEAIMHPKYATQNRQYNRDQARLQTTVKLADDAARVSNQESNAKAIDTYRTIALKDRVDAAAQRSKDREAAVAERVLTLHKQGIERVLTGTPLTEGEKADGAYYLPDFAGDAKYQLKVNPRLQMVTDPEMLKYFQMDKPGLRSQEEIAKAAGIMWPTTHRAPHVDTTNFDQPVSIEGGKASVVPLPPGVKRAMSPSAAEADKDRHSREGIEREGLDLRRETARRADAMAENRASETKVSRMRAAESKFQTALAKAGEDPAAIASAKAELLKSKQEAQDAYEADLGVLGRNVSHVALSNSPGGAASPPAGPGRGQAPAAPQTQGPKKAAPGGGAAPIRKYNRQGDAIELRNGRWVPVA